MKKIIVHLVGAALTGIVFFYAFHAFNSKASLGELLSSYSETSIVTALFLFVFILSALLIVVHYVLYYIFFLISPNRQACGLYVEAYLVGEDPRLSLLVVSFDIHREQLRVTGHSYRQHKTEKGELEPWARWRSKAVAYSDRGDFDLFYIHEGTVHEGTATQTTVPGTAICTLPLQERLCRTGSFCDLIIDGKTNLTPQLFDIIRARRIDQKEFRKEMPPMARFAYRLKLSAPGDDVFQAFALSKKGKLLEPFKGASRGRDCTRVFEALK